MIDVGLVDRLTAELEEERFRVESLRRECSVLRRERESLLCRLESLKRELLT